MQDSHDESSYASIEPFDKKEEIQAAAVLAGAASTAVVAQSVAKNQDIQESAKLPGDSATMDGSIKSSSVTQLYSQGPCGRFSRICCRDQ